VQRSFFRVGCHPPDIHQPPEIFSRKTLKLEVICPSEMSLISYQTTRYHHLEDRSMLGFEVLTVVSMKSTAFWDMTLCSSVYACKPFACMYCFHLQDRRMRPVSRALYVAFVSPYVFMSWCLIKHMGTFIFHRFCCSLLLILVLVTAVVM
jgi:hypothetical protein